MNEEAEDLTHEADVVPTRAQRLQIYRSYIYTFICSNQRQQWQHLYLIK